MVQDAPGCYLPSVTDGVWQFDLRLPRNAYTPREVPRAADLWRLCQDAATLASIGSDWPPQRFRDEKVAFIVYRMTMVHEGSKPYGALIQAKTWVSKLRRRTLSTREVRLSTDGQPLAAATQEWVHVDFETFKPKQGTPETAAAFPPVDVGPSVTMPDYDETPGSGNEFRFEMWQTWSDPLAHANHPAYLDWCDEATSRHMVEAGIDPVLLRPVAESVAYKNAVLPGEEVVVRTKRIGTVGLDAVVLRHEMTTERGSAAEATTIRTLADGDGARWIHAWD
jgi:acyl-CoA thioesterase FadM